ncbi:hypothetical protein S245_015537, partial [Arachis hypogaea]
LQPPLSPPAVTASGCRRRCRRSARARSCCPRRLCPRRHIRLIINKSSKLPAPTIAELLSSAVGTVATGIVTSIGCRLAAERLCHSPSCRRETFARRSSLAVANCSCSAIFSSSSRTLRPASLSSSSLLPPCSSELTLSWSSLCHRRSSLAAMRMMALIWLVVLAPVRLESKLRRGVDIIVGTPGLVKATVRT